MLKKSLGFTLGEILIALGVIGVVAALVIPQLVNGHKSGTAKAQFNTAYSMITKAVADMDADNISVEPATYATSGGFYRQFKKYIKYSVDCGVYGATNESVCMSTSRSEASPYKRLNGTAFTTGENNLLDDGCVVANNGMMFCIENPTGNFYGLMVIVDINGKNKNPNRLGYDLFAFEILKGGEVLPLGATGTGKSSSAKTLWGKDEASVNRYCNKAQNIAWSGITCAYKAATNEEYFSDLYFKH